VPPFLGPEQLGEACYIEVVEAATEAENAQVLPPAGELVYGDQLTDVRPP
jgi:hypothetical protein